MSDAPTDPADTTAPEPAPAPAETPDVPAAETPPATPTEAAPATTIEPDEAPKPKPGDRRFAQITARLAAVDEARKAAERRAEAAEALVRAGKPDGDPATDNQLPRETVEQAAARLVAQREFDRNRQSVVAQGVKEFGEADWNEKTTLLGNLGATDNAHFMAALVELPNAPKIVAALADDPDGLVALLEKSPAAMAAKLGRMDAQLDKTAAAAPKAPVSNAPRPPTPVSNPAVVPEPDVYDEKLSMEQYVALRRKTAPRHLGGSGRAA